VVRAIEVVDRALDQRGAPVYVRRQIVHNTHVVRRLEERGAVFVDELADVPVGSTVVFSAHGVAPEVRAEAQRRGLDIIDATCPLVAKVHAEARRFADEGDTVILIGHRGHEEAVGTLGERPGSTVLVQDPTDAERVEVPDPDRVGYLVQTTLAADEVAGIVEVLERRFPSLQAPPSDDICYATTNRQLALREVARQAELVLVVGSQNSSNSRRLVETAQRQGLPAHLIDDADDLDLGWLVGVTTVGLTAGASAPQELVDEVVTAIGGLGPLEVTEARLLDENVHFNVPKEVRSS
jgi:4-hydroxy-3-methylbut-2-enyl diphosphate reductase